MRSCGLPPCRNSLTSREGLPTAERLFIPQRSSQMRFMFSLCGGEVISLRRAAVSVSQDVPARWTLRAVSKRCGVYRDVTFNPRLANPKRDGKHLFARAGSNFHETSSTGAPVVCITHTKRWRADGAVEVKTGGVPITASLHAWPTGQIADRTAVDPAWAHCPCARSSRGGP